MNGLVLFMIFSVMTFDYLVVQGWIPGVVKYSPELISMAVVLIVVARGIQSRFEYVRPGYWIVFTALIIVMICGVVANAVDSGPIFAAIRGYLRPLPMFLLAAVYAFSEKQIRTQLKLIVLMTLPQFAVGWHQRMAALGRGDTSGDDVGGTLLGSGLLSIFLICVACGLTAAYMRKRISLPAFILLFIIVLAPTTINETKATIVILPIALFVTFILGSERGKRLKSTVLATTLLAVFGAIFVPVYDYFIEQREYAPTLMDFFSDEEKMSGYMGGEATVGVKEAGRMDGIVFPLKEMAKDPAKSGFGLGIGNASHSQLGKQFIGEYYTRYEPFLTSAASMFILELGIGGFILVLALYALIYSDARIVAKADPGIIGMVALSWTGITAVIALTTFYADVTASESISYLFWYFSGLIAAQRMRLCRAEKPVRLVAANA